ncbi:unnamed protein product, partial [Allacma fusca]
IRDIRGIRVGSSNSWFNPESRSMVTRFVPKQNRGVFIISSGHYSQEDGEVSSDITKPAVVRKYNNTMYGVDMVDEMLATYYAIFPTRRWPVRVFFHLVHTVAYNAFVLFTLKFPNWRKKDCSKRLIALRQLIDLLIIPQVQRRKQHSSSEQLQVRRSWDIVLNVFASPVHNVLPLPRAVPDEQEGNTNPQPRRPEIVQHQERRMRKRCDICVRPSTVRRISQAKCCRCNRFICNDHRYIWCDHCTEQRYVD